jgi:hypothetical protein
MDRKEKFLVWVEGLPRRKGRAEFINFPKGGRLIAPLSRYDQRELLEVVEERYDRKATIVTSQLPIKAWHDAMQDPTLADAILDWLVHNAYKLELKGESMRRKKLLDQKTDPVTE